MTKYRVEFRGKTELPCLNRFVEIMSYEFTIDRSNNGNKAQKYFRMIDDIVLNALAQGRKIQKAYDRTPKQLSNKKTNC